MKQWSASKICGALAYLHENNLLFRSRTKDSIILYDIAKKLKQKGTLTIRQIDAARYRLSKYKRELAGVDFPEVTVLEPDGSSLYSVSLHNPRTFRVHVPIKAPIVAQVKRLSGVRYRDDKGFFTCEATKRNGHVLLNSGFVMDSRATRWMDQPNQCAPLVDVSSLLRTPRPYQHEGISFLMQHNGRAILADEMGLGKSGQALSWAYLAAVPKICVVCPASAKGNWAREILLWTGEESAFLCEGRTVSKQDKEAVNFHKWLIINWDILHYWQKLFIDVGVHAYLFDEVHAIKNPKTQRTKASLKLAKKAKHIVAISGTPLENRPIELHSIIQMIDPALFPFRLQYAAKFCDLHEDQYGRQVMTGSSNGKELNKILTDTMMLRRLKKDVANDLPPKTRIVVPLVMKPAFAKEYRDAEKEFTQWLIENKSNKKKLKAAALIQLNKLKQIAMKAKMPQLFEWIDDYLEVENKLAVFAYHHNVIDALVDRYKQRAVTITGKVANSKRFDLIERFQEDPKVNLFFGNIKAAGTAITLTAACATVTAELVWTPSAHQQVEDRVHRIGQTREVTSYYLLMQGTVEERIATLLDSKQSIISEILDGEDPVSDSLLTDLLNQYLQE